MYRVKESGGNAYDLFRIGDVKTKTIPGSL